MITKLYSRLCKAFPSFNKRTKKTMYQFMSGRYRKADWTFMNYGYAPLDAVTEATDLEEEDEPNRYGIQLYHHLANAVDIEGLDVLEVGSGRGGGAHYIKHYLGPRRMVGLDYSENAIEFCNDSYCVEGLVFIAGDAESLPFSSNSFDVVVNVESSHCYRSMEAFLMQVKRVLRRGGTFLCADFRDQGRLGTLGQRLSRSGMTLIDETDITPNILRALDLDNERKMAHIERAVPKLFLNTFKQFAGVRGSNIYERFRTGQTVYKSFVLQKM